MPRSQFTPRWGRAPAADPASVETVSDTVSESASAAGGPGLTGDERAELERLRAAAAKKKRRRGGWRAPLATLLIMVGCLLAPVSVLGVWTASQVSDTGRYVANITPLIDSPPIQNALTDKVTGAITSNLDVRGYVNQAAGTLDSRGLTGVAGLLQSFGPSIDSAADGFIRNAVYAIVNSQQFANAWVQVNTAAHQTLVQVLSGGKGAVSTSNGQVTIVGGPPVAPAPEPSGHG